MTLLVTLTLLFITLTNHNIEHLNDWRKNCENVCIIDFIVIIKINHKLLCPYPKLYVVTSDKCIYHFQCPIWVVLQSLKVGNDRPRKVTHLCSTFSFNGCQSSFECCFWSANFNVACHMGKNKFNKRKKKKKLMIP